MFCYNLSINRILTNTTKKGGEKKLIFNLLGGFFSTLGKLISRTVGIFFNALTELFYYVFMGIMYIINFCEEAFKKVAGIESLKINNTVVGGENSNDLVTFLIRNETVQNVFFSILLFSIVLLVIFTIVSFIKSEFEIEASKAAKWPIVQRAIKGLFHFLLVPAISLVAVFAVNVLTRAVWNLVSPNYDGSMLLSSCFRLGTQDANRARKEGSDYVAFLVFDAFDYNQGGTTNDKTKSPFSYYIQEIDPASQTVTFQNLGDVGTAGLTYTKKELYNVDKTNTTFAQRLVDVFAERIDNMFEIYGGIEFSSYGQNGRIYNKTTDLIYHPCDSDIVYHTDCSLWDMIDEYGYAPSMSYSNYAFMGKAFSKPYFDNPIIDFYYSFKDMSYILMIGSAMIIAWSLLNMCLMLVKRALELVIVFLIYPVATSLFPIDNGSAEGSARKEFQKRLVAIVAPIFAYNMFFILMELLKDISPFSGAMAPLFNVLFDVVVLVAGLSMLKQANSLFTGILGLGDLLTDASNIGKKTAGMAAGAALMATGVGVAGVKGAAALLNRTRNPSRNRQIDEENDRISELQQQRTTKEGEAETFKQQRQAKEEKLRRVRNPKKRQQLQKEANDLLNKENASRAEVSKIDEQMAQSQNRIDKLTLAKEGRRINKKGKVVNMIPFADKSWSALGSRFVSGFDKSMTTLIGNEKIYNLLRHPTSAFMTDDEYKARYGKRAERRTERRRAREAKRPRPSSVPKISAENMQIAKATIADLEGFGNDYKNALRDLNDAMRLQGNSEYRQQRIDEAQSRLNKLDKDNDLDAKARASFLNEKKDGSDVYHDFANKFEDNMQQFLAQQMQNDKNSGYLNQQIVNGNQSMIALLQALLNKK